MERFTIAGPIAQLRKFQTTLAAELPATPRPVASMAPTDPSAPVGPRPTFQVTPLERLRERPPVMPPVASEAIRSEAIVRPDEAEPILPRLDILSPVVVDGAAPDRAVDRFV